jgi:alpha-L-arabinofuranosidase
MNLKIIVGKTFFITIILVLTNLLLNAQISSKNKTHSIKPGQTATICEVSVDTLVSHQISKHLVGFNVIYPHEKDIIWDDGKIVSYLKDINTSIIRYPGGTVTSFYHWESLSGHGWADSWDPDNELVDKPGAEFMDLDEYIGLIRKTGASPLVGINMSSGWRWNNVEKGISEALALMEYCRNNNFNVKYWYLDNEPYQHDSNGGAKSPLEYANLINQFAPRMKEFNPDIKIIANWNAGFKGKRKEYEVLLKEAGKNIDIIDVHWYWAWQKPDQVGEWLSKTPMERWTSETYIEEIALFRQMITELGYPDLEIASLEWNAGPDNDQRLNAFQSAAIQGEMLMQYVIGGLDMATFWPIHWPDSKQWSTRGFIENKTFSKKPNYPIFKFFGQVQGNDLLKSSAINPLPNTLFFASLDRKENVINIAFLNKNPFEVSTEINLNNFGNLHPVKVETYKPMHDNESNVLQEGIIKLRENNKLSFLCPGLSLTMLSIETKK